LYAERFNRRDWDGLRELISEDAQLRISEHLRRAIPHDPRQPAPGEAVRPPRLFYDEAT
jgi:hypothetical protein